MEKLIFWAEIPSSNFERAVKFYETILDRKLNVQDYGKEKMAHFPSGDGAVIFSEGYLPSDQGVIVSLNVGDKLDQTISLIQENGGMIKVDKCKIEAPGRDYFAIFIDSEGNRLGIYGK